MSDIRKRIVNPNIKARTLEILDDIEKNSYWRMPLVLAFTSLRFYMEDHNLTKDDLIKDYGFTLEELDKYFYNSMDPNTPISFVAKICKLTGVEPFKK